MSPGDVLVVSRGMWKDERVTFAGRDDRGVQVLLPRHLWSPGYNPSERKPKLPVDVAWFSPSWLEPT